MILHFYHYNDVNQVVSKENIYMHVYQGSGPAYGNH